MKRLLLLFIPLMFFFSCEVSEEEEYILTGCMDINACNYSDQAVEDDSSCIYAEEYYDCAGNCLLYGTWNLNWIHQNEEEEEYCIIYCYSAVSDSPCGISNTEVGFYYYMCPNMVFNSNGSFEVNYDESYASNYDPISASFILNDCSPGGEINLSGSSEDFVDQNFIIDSITDNYLVLLTDNGLMGLSREQ